jgi:tetratricopeptide (TPR) repeat protein
MKIMQHRYKARRLFPRTSGKLLEPGVLFVLFSLPLQNLRQSFQTTLEFRLTQQMVSKILIPQEPNQSGANNNTEVLVDSSKTDNRIELAHAFYNKGRKLWTKGNKDEALSCFRKAVAIQEISLGSKHPHTAESYYFIGYALSKYKNEYDKALVAYRRTLRSRLWTNGNEDVATEDVQRAIKELLINTMRHNETDVEEYFAQATKSVQYEKQAKDLVEKEEYEKAVEAYEECLLIESDALGKFPLDLGRLYFEIGAAQKRHNEYEMALNAYRNALQVFVPTLGKEHADSKRCVEGIESCSLSKNISKEMVQEYLQMIFLSLDHCRRGDEYMESEDYNKAVEEFEAARSIEESYLGKYPLTAVSVRQKLARIFERRKQYDRTIFELRTILSINIFDCGSDHPSVAAVVKSIGMALNAKGVDAETINRYTNTVAFSVKHQRYGEHLLIDEKDFSAAIEEFQKSLALEAVLGKYHVTQGALFKSIGDSFLAEENFDFAVVNYRNALLVYLPMLGKEHIDTKLTLFMIGSAAAQSVGLDGDEVDEYRANVSESILLEKLADSISGKGDKEEAIEKFENAVSLEESSLVEYHLSTADLHSKIATVLKDSQQHDRAIVRYRNILATYLRALGADHPNTQNAHDELVKVVTMYGLGEDRAKGYGQKVLVSIEHEARGDQDLAHQRNTQGIGEFRKALEIEENSLGVAHLVTAALYGKLADGYRRNGRSADAIQEYRKAIQICVKHGSPEHDATKLLRGLGKCIEDLGFNENKGMQYRTVIWESVKSEQSGDNAQKAGDHHKALYHYQRSISLEESVLGKLHPSTSTTYKKIADIYRDNDDFESAILFYSKVLAIQESHLGKDDEKTVKCFNDLMNASQKKAVAMQAEVDGWIMMQYVIAGLIGLLVVIGSITKLLSNKKRYTTKLNNTYSIEIKEKNLSKEVKMDPSTSHGERLPAGNLFSNPPNFESFRKKAGNSLVEPQLSSHEKVAEDTITEPEVYSIKDITEETENIAEVAPEPEELDHSPSFRIPPKEDPSSNSTMEAKPVTLTLTSTSSYLRETETRIEPQPALTLADRKKKFQRSLWKGNKK